MPRQYHTLIQLSSRKYWITEKKASPLNGAFKKLSKKFFGENMNKKATVRDVAREAGVSTATVSYIMNDRQDQKISPETRKKVLQIANLLNYRPSHAAKSLATGRNNIIGIAYSLNPATPSRNLEITNFANLLIERLNRMNYDVLFVSLMGGTNNPLANRNIDAIIAIDLTHEQFRRLADTYLVPVIAVDMMINDNLFYQIYTDYPSLIEQAAADFQDDYYLIIDRFANDAFSDFIISEFSADRVIVFSENIRQRLSDLKTANVIVIGSYLGLMLLPYVDSANIRIITSKEHDITLPADVTLIHNDVSKKANLTINVLLNSLERNFDLEHDLKVL